MSQILSTLLSDYWKLIVAFLAGGLLVWLKDYFTIAKLREEIGKLKGDKLVQLHGYQSKYRELMKQIKDLASQYIHLWCSDCLQREQLDAVREKMCAAVDDAIVAYSQLVELHCVSFSKDKARSDLLVEDTVAEFRQWKLAIRNINNANVLKFLGGKEPLRIHYRGIKQMAVAVSRLADGIDGKQQLIDEINQFITAANPEGGQPSAR